MSDLEVIYRDKDGKRVYPTAADHRKTREHLRRQLAGLGWPFVADKPPKRTATTSDTSSNGARRRWMDKKHPGWSLPDWREHTGLAYETLKKYRDDVP